MGLFSDKEVNRAEEIFDFLKQPNIIEFLEGIAEGLKMANSEKNILAGHENGKYDEACYLLGAHIISLLGYCDEPQLLDSGKKNKHWEQVGIDLGYLSYVLNHFPFLVLERATGGPLGKNNYLLMVFIAGKLRGDDKNIKILYLNLYTKIKDWNSKIQSRGAEIRDSEKDDAQAISRLFG